MRYTPYKSPFFLRPFYVLSTSFLRNGYMEVRELHIMHNLCIYVQGIPVRVVQG